MSRIAFITGATSGIGEATARIFSDHGIDLIICGRREKRLQSLQAKLSQKVKVHTLTFDVKDRDKVFQIIDDLPEEWKKIDILVNNAGNAHGYDSIHEGSLDDWESMIDINVKGLLYVSRAVIPGMVERRSGHVINIGSIAGKEVYPKGNVYCASKHAVDAINNGMRIDLNQYGIKVSQINPGLVDTEFSMVRFKGDKQRSKSVYNGMKPLTGNDIADLILFIVTRPPHVNISDSIIFPTAQASSTLVNRDQS
jgi:NADP-dependent 3-hydroxy acid dehydrogenase YdfG